MPRQPSLVSATEPPEEGLPGNDTNDVPARFAVAIGRLNRTLRPTQPSLSHGLMMALSTIVRCGPVRPGALAKVEGVSAPSATRLVIDLENRGLVSRIDDPDDGRSFFVVATDAGREEILEARAERAAHAQTLLDSLDETERTTILGALQALERAAGLDN
jgi:DNA-binding MarR family transcriptional regulator